MPIEYRVDEHRRLVLTRIHGVVDEAQVRALALRTAQDPNVQRCDRGLVDIDPNVDVRVTASVVSEFAMPRDEQALARRRVAIIAPTDKSYGLARVFQGYRGDAGDNAMQVFRTRAEAEAWLGLDDERAT